MGVGQITDSLPHLLVIFTSIPIPATSEESRPPTLDKQQRSYLKELPKVTFLKMLLPFVRKRVEVWSTAYLFLYIDSHIYIYVSVYMIIHAYMYLHRYVNVNIYIFIHVIILIHIQICVHTDARQGTELDAAVVLQLLMSEISVRSPGSPAPTVLPPTQIRIVFERMSLAGLVSTACTILPQDRFPKLMKNELDRLRKAIRAFDLDTLGWWGQMSRHHTLKWLVCRQSCKKTRTSWVELPSNASFQCLAVAQQRLHIMPLNHGGYHRKVLCFEMFWASAFSISLSSTNALLYAWQGRTWPFIADVQKIKKKGVIATIAPLQNTVCDNLGHLHTVPYHTTSQQNVTFHSIT